MNEENDNRVIPRPIAPFMVSCSHLHYNVIQRGCKFRAKTTKQPEIASHAYNTRFIVMQRNRVNHEKGYSNGTSIENKNNFNII